MEILKSKGILPILEIAKVNLKYNALLSVMVSAVIIIITPMIFGTDNLDNMASAVPLEMFVSLVGIILLTPIFQPEQNEDINDIVSSKYISTSKIYLIRTAYSAIILTSLISLFGIYMKAQNCDVTPLLIIGTLANAVFLGSLGMIFAAISNSTIIGYMIPMVYYALNFGMGSKLGNYYLFSMSNLDFKPKIWLIITGGLLISASLLVKQIKKRFR